MYSPCPARSPTAGTRFTGWYDFMMDLYRPCPARSPTAGTRFTGWYDGMMGLYRPCPARSLSLHSLIKKIRAGNWSRAFALRSHSRSDLSAVRGGFEPPVRFDSYDGLANRWFQPLIHLTCGLRIAKIGFFSKTTIVPPQKSRCYLVLS